MAAAHPPRELWQQAVRNSSNAPRARSTFCCCRLERRQRSVCAESSGRQNTAQFVVSMKKVYIRSFRWPPNTSRRRSGRLVQALEVAGEGRAAVPDLDLDGQIAARSPCCCCCCCDNTGCSPANRGVLRQHGSRCRHRPSEDLSVPKLSAKGTQPTKGAQAIGAGPVPPPLAGPAAVSSGESGDGGAVLMF